MSFFSIFMIAVGLAMDAFAVSISSGSLIRQNKFQNALKVALAFGLFQMLMPVIGWSAGSTLHQWIRGIDHWIAFSLLSLIGIKMIHESFRVTGERNIRIDNFYILLGLAVATSIDALMVGFSFSVLNVTLVTPVMILGVVTFAMSFGGFLIGNRFGHFFENKVELIGGLILIALGVKILMEHL